MQAPQILGMLIGAALIAFSIFIWRAQRDEKKRTWVGILAVTAFYFGMLSFAQNAIFSYAATWSWEGIF
jgi:hypothetical protein